MKMHVSMVHLWVAIKVCYMCAACSGFGTVYSVHRARLTSLSLSLSLSVSLCSCCTVFMVQRSLESKFFPGAHVFPGGAVEKSDNMEHWHTLFGDEFGEELP
eukprot:TRINITY_DN1786_c0_g1_i2.p1 TRINITY_DN1786_c0_g1~~TRINITY_DN1786_c0_g1_i2.p1  ORF type:complete len:102 (+),score=18.05 TRINITY_DN1786_c0_g1_i2:387-692(+)